jgi:hypothetical protein
MHKLRDRHNRSGVGPSPVGMCRGSHAATRPGAAYPATSATSPAAPFR